VREFAKFDKAMTEAFSIMGDLNEGLQKQMKDTAIALSKEGVKSAEDLAHAYFFLASAGFNAEEAMSALPVLAKFATAGNFEMARATDLLADALSALGLRSKDPIENIKNLTRVSDVLTKANILANASVEQFSAALTNRAAAALRAAKKDVEEGAAVLAVFADQGTKGEEAGEALAIVLRDLQRTAIENKQVFHDMGINIYDASGNMRNMADIVEDFDKSLAGASVQQKRLAFELLGFQDRSLSNILALMGTSEQIRIYERELRKAGGTTDEVAGKQLQAFSAQLTITVNNIRALFIAIGEALAPALLQLNAYLKEISADPSFVSALKEMAGYLGTTIVVAIKAAVEAFKYLRTGIKVVELAFWSIAETSLVVFQKVTTVLQEIINSFLTGVNTVIAGVNQLLQKFGDKLNTLQRFVNPLGSALGGPTAPDFSKKIPMLGDVSLGMSPEAFDNAIKQFGQLKAGVINDLVKPWLEEVPKIFPVVQQMADAYDEAYLKGIEHEEKMAAALSGTGKAYVEASEKMKIYLAQMEAMQKVTGAQSPLNRMGIDAEGAKALYGAGVSAETLQGLARPTLPKTVMGDDLHVNALMSLRQEKEDAENRLAILEEMGNKELEQNEQFMKLKEEAIKAHNARLRALQYAEAQMVLQAGQNMFDSLAQAVKGFAGEQSKAYMAMFAASKAFAVADATVKIAQGVANALSLPWPANLVAAASVVAAAANIITTIQSVQLAISGNREFGGGVSAGKAYMVGEKGPEVFSPASNGTILPNDRVGGNVRVVINNYTDAKASVTERQEGSEKVIEIVLKRLKSEMASEVRDGRGEVSRALESSYSLRRGK